ncbi:MAG: hypothetical protein V4682_02980 [Patescibacteria group bacterium]
MSEGFGHDVPKASTVPEKGQERLLSFPIVDDEHEYSIDEYPPFQDGTIVHFVCSDWMRPLEKRHRFITRKAIGGHPYILRLDQRYSNESKDYTLQSETEGFGFATMNLDPEESAELFKTRAAFIESFTSYTKVPIESIESSPAGTSYSVEDVKTCIERILAHPNASTTREELESLSAKYEGARIFETYNQLYGEYFHGEHPNERSRASARSRLFAAMFKKYLEHWEVADRPYTREILLRRKQTAE